MLRRSPSPRRPRATPVLAVTLLLALAGCGIKGPLKPPPGTTTPPPPPPSGIEMPSQVNGGS
ncbi:MAG: lipoprotein [Proteobacteria bacterium]|nr:lipoprotein [Pseudomonadota bacterium]